MVGLSIKLPIFVLVVVFEVFEGSDEENWRKHNAKVEMFKCRQPQPRSFRWKELDVDFEINDKEDIHPPTTVLHRCQSAGCCNNRNKVCLSRKDEIVHLTFARFGDRGRIYFNVSAVNHTECSCQKDSDRPK